VLGVLYLAYRQLDSRGQWESERWQIFTDPPLGQSAEDVWRSLVVTGLGATLRAAAVSALIAAVVGLVLAIARMARVRWVRWPTTAVIEFYRGLPVVLLMFFGVIALGLPIFSGVVFGLVIYNSSIIAEILRAGIVSLPKGQSEAAYAIGLSRTQTLLIILLPQAVRRMLPSLVSQLVVLLKDSSLGFIIGYAELLRRLQQNTQFFGQRYWFQFFVVGAAIYIAVNFTLSRLAVWLEHRGTAKAAGGVAAADQAEITGTRAAGAEQ
jgi:glutamate transport system permease protein